MSSLGKYQVIRSISISHNITRIHIRCVINGVDHIIVSYEANNSIPLASELRNEEPSYKKRKVRFLLLAQVKS